jgi:hypothetical protein
METIMFALAKFFEGRTTQTLNEYPTVRQSVCADLLAQGWTPAEALAFVREFLLPESQLYGRPIFSHPEAAARYSGGIDCIDPWMAGGVCYWSVLWDDSGCRGGAGGGIKEWFHKGEPIGWVTF